MNITNFMTWFIQQFINIGSNMLGLLERIQIYSNVSLLDFIITITILGALLGILITSPNLTIVNRINQEKVNKAKRAKKERKK